MQGLGTSGAGDVEKDQEGVWVGAPKAPSIRRMFDDERAMEAVLTFLRAVKVGSVFSIVPREYEFI